MTCYNNCYSMTSRTKSQMSSTIQQTYGTLNLAVQDQDSLGGGFDSNQAFGGKISELNWLEVALSSDQVNAIYKAGTGSPLPSSMQEKTILKWKDILNNPLSGNVIKEEYLIFGKSPSRNVHIN